jgi:hypothetical protein
VLGAFGRGGEGNWPLNRVDGTGERERVCANCSILDLVLFYKLIL